MIVTKHYASNNLAVYEDSCLTNYSYCANLSCMAKRTPLRRWLTAARKTDKTKNLTWLAKELDLSVSYTCELVAGKQPSLDVAARIEDLTGIPCRDLAKVA